MGQVLTQFHATVGIMATDGQVLGQGCVYPTSARTLVDQFEAEGRTPPPRRQGQWGQRCPELSTSYVAKSEHLGQTPGCVELGVICTSSSEHPSLTSPG